MQHKKQFLDREKGPAKTPKSRSSDPTPISAHFEEAIRGLARRNGITYEEAVKKLEGKVQRITPS